MLRFFIEKELKQLILTQRFIWLFLITTILMTLATYIGIQEYQKAAAQFDITTQLSDQNLQEERKYESLHTIIHRKPDPLQALISGIHYDVGRRTVVSKSSSTELNRSPYSDEPLFAVFRILDLSTIVQLVLTLFALLLSYNAVSGEYERGTLKLMLANGIPRIRIIISKWIGISSGLAMALIIPFLISAVLIRIYQLPLEQEDWIKLLIFVASSFLLLFIFVGIGLTVSSFSKSSSHSFVALLLIWMVVSLIIPRLGVMTAGSVIQASGQAEIDAKVAAYKNTQWDEYQEDLGKKWEERNTAMEGMNPEERKAYRQEHEWEWMEENEEMRNELQRNIEMYRRRIQQEANNSKKRRKQIGFTLARVSPVAAYQLLVMDLSRTDIGLKRRYQEQLNRYQTELVNYVEEMSKKHNQTGGFRISITNEGVSIKDGRQSSTLDISGMPGFTHPTRSLVEIVQATLFSFSTMLVMLAGVVIVSFVGIVRYDVS